MSDLFFEGIATEFDKPFLHGDEYLVLKSGCFDGSLSADTEIRFLCDHDASKCFSSNRYPLEVYADKKALAFRFALPDRKGNEFRNAADDFETYVGMSIGLTKIKTETVMIDGIPVTFVLEAKLNEVSALSRPPAVQTTFGRVVSAECRGSLQDDYETGMFQMASRFIGVHRKFSATLNGGEIAYNNVTSSYDRTANAFEQALSRLQ